MNTVYIVFFIAFFIVVITNIFLNKKYSKAMNNALKTKRINRGLILSTILLLAMFLFLSKYNVSLSIPHFVKPLMIALGLCFMIVLVLYVYRDKKIFIYIIIGVILPLFSAILLQPFLESSPVLVGAIITFSIIVGVIMLTVGLILTIKSYFNRFKDR